MVMGRKYKELLRVVREGWRGYTSGGVSSF
jgi:hypothetical protein